MFDLNRTTKCYSCDQCNDQSEFFRLLSKKESRLLDEERYEVQFKTGENIVKQGTILTHIANIVSGLVKIYIEGYNHKNILLSIAGNHSILGGPGLFTDNRNHYTITALKPTSVCFINSENFKKVLESNNKFNSKFIEHLNNKTLFTFRKIISLTQKQMHGKMADALIYLYDVVYKNTEFALHLNRQDLADMTAMSKDSAIRILKEFERDGIASIDGRSVKILNIDSLRELSELG